MLYLAPYARARDGIILWFGLDDSALSPVWGNSSRHVSGVMQHPHSPHSGQNKSASGRPAPFKGGVRIHEGLV